jgi:hypothetical protein
MKTKTNNAAFRNRHVENCHVGNRHVGNRHVENRHVENCHVENRHLASVSFYTRQQEQQQHAKYQALSYRNDSNNTSYIRLCPAEKTATTRQIAGFVLQK